MAAGGLLSIYVIALAVDIYAFSFVTDLAPADAAVVLGAAAVGGQPSPVFEKRLRHAVDLYQTGKVHFLIVTGGQGANEPRAEALVVRTTPFNMGCRLQIWFAKSPRTSSWKICRAPETSSGRADWAAC